MIQNRCLLDTGRNMIMGTANTRLCTLRVMNVIEKARIGLTMPIYMK